MKRWLVFLCILIPVFITLSLIVYIFHDSIKNILSENKNENNNKVNELKEIELKAGTTIRVKFTKTSEVVAMDINDYLRGVVPSEMSPSYNMEALKAQAVVARTFTYKKMESMPNDAEFDITDSYQIDQAFYTKDKLFEIWRNKGYDENTINNYWNRVTQAVQETQGMVVTYNGEYIKAYFHASSPGKTENVSQIWGNQSLPYLVSVESVENSDYQWLKSTVELSMEDFKNKIVQNVDSRFSLDNRSADDIIKVEDYTTSGRVKNTKIGNNIVSAEKLRTILGLRSTNFTVCIENGKVVFSVIGYGHGVGLSQVGANCYASTGMNYIDIIKHYYTGVEVIKVN